MSRSTNPKVASRIARIVAQVDADAAADRAAKARATRHVRTEALPDGMGAVTVETGREAITAIVADLDTAMATAKAGGDARCPGQIRADELIHRMTLGAFGAPAHPGSNPYSLSTRAPARTRQRPAPAATRPTRRAVVPARPAPRSCDPDRPSAGPGTSGGGGGAGVAGEFDDAAGDLAGVAHDPGELDGYGPIPAALARQIARDAARDHPTTTTWRCVPIDDTHRTVLGVGDTIPTPKHDPTGRQRDLVQTADPFCVWPGCGRRSLEHGTDIDHRVPYDDGGATCPCNLQPLCRTHHRMKGTGLNTAQPAARPDRKSRRRRGATPSRAGGTE